MQQKTLYLGKFGKGKGKKYFFKNYKNKFLFFI